MEWNGMERNSMRRNGKWHGVKNGLIPRRMPRVIIMRPHVEAGMEKPTKHARRRSRADRSHLTTCPPAAAVSNHAFASGRAWENSTRAQTASKSDTRERRRRDVVSYSSFKTTRRLSCRPTPRPACSLSHRPVTSDCMSYLHHITQRPACFLIPPRPNSLRGSALL